MRNYIYLIRRVTSLALLITWLVTGATGFLMLVAELGIRVPPIAIDLHTYLGFTALGISVIHGYLNSAAIKNYLGLKK